MSSDFRAYLRRLVRKGRLEVVCADGVTETFGDGQGPLLGVKVVGSPGGMAADGQSGAVARRALHGRTIGRHARRPLQLAGSRRAEPRRNARPAVGAGAARDSRRLSRPAPAQRPAAREAQHRQSLRPRRAPLRSLPRFGPPIQLRLFRISRPIARRRADGEEAPYRRQAPAEGRRDGARHRLRLWRPGALSCRGRRSQGHRRHPVQRAIHRRDRSRPPGGPGRPGRISAPGLPRRRRDLRPDRLGRHVRARRRRPLRRIFRHRPPAARRTTG